MFTQCPKCQSVFMVSDKDIRAHEGLVRCGNCYSVFNSSWNLTDDPRDEVEESGVSDSAPAANQESGFTFSLLGNDTGSSAAVESVSDLSEGMSESEIKESRSTDEDRDQPAEDFLEPFPEPEVEDDLSPSLLAAEEDKKNNDSLLYFDSDEESGNKTDAIEDTSIMQMPSFTDDGELASLDDPPLMEPDTSESETELMSMTEDSMWPGSDVNFEDIGGNFDLPVLDDAISEAEPATSDASESLPELPDIAVDAPDVEADLVEGLSDPFHFNETAGNDEVALPEIAEEAVVDQLAGEEFAGEETVPLEPFLPALEAESKAADVEQDHIPGSEVSTDDVIITDEQNAEEGEYISVESLPASADEAFATDTDEEDESDADSVFITSEANCPS